MRIAVQIVRHGSTSSKEVLTLAGAQLPALKSPLTLVA